MENASKALLMAGGILIALLVISALILMFNQISVFKQSETSNEKNTQLAKFNMDFEKYLDDKGVSGSDIVSLANKITDYNSKSGTIHDVTNSVDYSIKMSLLVDMTGFKDKYGYPSGGVFSDGLYYVGPNQGGIDLKTTIDYQNAIFNANNKKLLAQLADVYDGDASSAENVKNIKKVLIEKNASTYASWDGTSFPELNLIKNYKECTEFRTSTFEVSQDPEYENGQIQKMYFKWKK